MQKADDATRKAQRLRLQRLLWGFITQLCLLLILGIAAYMNFIEPVRVVHVAAAVSALNAGYLACIRTGINLRFRDPSLTGAQVMLSLLPAVYAMYYLEEPQVRVAVVLMATVGMLFATLAYGTRQLLWLAGYHVLAYTLTVAALMAWAPERIHPAAEIPVVFAYAIVLVLIALLGSFIAGLRRKLHHRNQELHRTMAELQELATRDPLTRLPNRRAVMEHLAHEASRAERRTPLHQSLCMCMADVDHFKRVNDEHGHQAGDDVLCAVGEALRGTLRQGDFVGRFGGEEFLLLFPESTREGAKAAAERVRAAIEGMRVAELPGHDGITISLGVAVHRPGASMEATLQRADQALYQAKAAGRNRVILAEPHAEGEGGEAPAPPDDIAAAPHDPGD